MLWNLANNMYFDARLDRGTKGFCLSHRGRFFRDNAIYQKNGNLFYNAPTDTINGQFANVLRVFYCMDLLRKTILLFPIQNCDRFDLYEKIIVNVPA